MSCQCYGCTHNVRCPKCTNPDVRLVWTTLADEVRYEWACPDCHHRWQSA